MQIEAQVNTRQKTVKIPVTLTRTEASALAQMVKRFGHGDAVRLSNAYDGGRERDDMIDAVIALQRALAEHGFNPR